MASFINFEELPEATEEPAERSMDRISDRLNRSLEELEPPGGWIAPLMATIAKGMHKPETVVA